MTAADLVERRRHDWERLAALCDQAPRIKSGRAHGDEIAEIARLYRRAVADLGRLRTLSAAEGSAHGAAPPAVDWLNALVARAHAVVYVARPLALAQIAAFLTHDFPRRFRRAWKLIALATALFVGSTAIAYALSYDDVAVARGFALPGLEENARGFAKLGEGRDGATDVVMTSFYISNNVRVAFTAFAFGVTAGLGTLYVLVQNGLIMGFTLAFVHHAGTTRNLLAFIVSHGPLELLAIFISAGAGLGMGHAIVVPGPYTRAVALRRAAVDAVALVIGAACLLVVAAFFEGFVSPSSLPMSVKAMIGAANAGALALYFGAAGRER